MAKAETGDQLHDQMGTLSLERQSQEARRWDDPPETGPVATSSQIQAGQSTGILVPRREEQLPHSRKHPLKVAFSPRGDKIAVMVPGLFEDPNTLYCLDAMSFQVIACLEAADFVFAPLPDDAIACSFLKLSQHHQVKEHHVRKPRLEIFDFKKGTARLKSYVYQQAPTALSPDGSLIAAVNAIIPHRMIILKTSDADSAVKGAVRSIPTHVDEVTHLSFTPDGTGLVSLSKDGACRLTSVATGRTLRKFEVEGRRNPQMLQVSPDGQLIVSIWGREIMLWYPSTGQMTTYSLTTVRQNEGWPLCISPDCKYLVCRTEDGLDISNLTTGQVQGESMREEDFATAAAFNTEGTLLAVGTQKGKVCYYEVNARS